MRVFGWLVIAGLVASGGRAWADETVTGLLDTSTYGAPKLTLTRNLPADAQIALTIQVSEGDITSAAIEVWPAADGACTSGVGGHQYQSLGLALGGTASARTLTATLAPLQLHTAFCFRVAYDAPLPPRLATAISQELGKLAVDDNYQCAKGAPTIPAAAFTDAVARVIPRFPATEELRTATLRGIDMVAVCRAIEHADAAITVAAGNVTSAAQVAAKTGSDAATANVKAANTALAAARDAKAAVSTLAGAVAKAAPTAIPTLLNAVSFHATASFMSTNSTTAASYASPVAGVIVAFPLLKNHKTGFGTPWLTPYLGASIYLSAVDRVVPLRDLVGSQFCQRFSFTIGLVASSPSINDKSVTGPWGIGVIPMLGAGYRLTQYIHADAGVILFKHADVNPVITDYDWGVAFWGGISIDADLWAIISGKLGK